MPRQRSVQEVLALTAAAFHGQSARQADWHVSLRRNWMASLVVNWRCHGTASATLFQPDRHIRVS